MAFGEQIDPATAQALARLLSQSGPGGLTPTLQGSPQEAQALQRRSSSSSAQPIRSPWQGAAELVDGLNGGVQDFIANRNAAQGAASAASDANAMASRPFGFGSVGTPNFSVTPAGGGGEAGDASSSRAAAPIFAGLTSGGLSPMAAAGVLGNFKQESNFSSDTRGGGDNGTAHGLGQWRLERWDNLQNYAAQRGADVNDPRLQTQFALDESKGIKLPDGRSVYDAVNQAQTPQEAAMLWGKYFERPKIVEPVRAAHAANYYAQFGQGGAQPTRGVQLAGPVPTPDTGAPPTALAPRASAPGFQAIAPQGAPTAGDVADAQTILADPVSPANARAYAQGVLQRAGGGAQATPAPQAAADQAMASTDAPGAMGGPAIPASGAPMPPPRSDFSASAAAPSQVAANFRPMLTPAGPQQAQQAPQNPLVAALMGLVGGGGQTVPDGRGGYVPASNSRYDPATGNFLTGGGGPPATTNMAASAPSPMSQARSQVGGAPMAQSPTSSGPGGYQAASYGAGQPQAQGAIPPNIAAAFRLAANPWAPAGMQALARAQIDLWQKRQEEAGMWSTYRDDDGSLMKRNNFTGDVAQVSKKDSQTTDIQNYEYAQQHGYGGSFTDFETQVKKAGATNVSTNVDLTSNQTYDKELAQGLAKAHAALANGVEDAQGRARDLAAMQGALDNIQKAGGATGFGEQEKLALRKAINAGANALGIEQPYDVSDPEFLTKFNRQIAGAQARNAVGARVTNFELANYLKANPGLDMSTTGNQRLIGIQSQIEQRNIAVGNAIREATAQAISSGQKINPVQVQKIITDYDQAHHITDPVTGQDLTQSYVLPEFQGGANAPRWMRFAGKSAETSKRSAPIAAGPSRRRVSSRLKSSNMSSATPGMTLLGLPSARLPACRLKRGSEMSVFDDVMADLEADARTLERAISLAERADPALVQDLRKSLKLRRDALKYVPQCQWPPRQQWVAVETRPKKSSLH